MSSIVDYWETTILLWQSHLMDVLGENQGSHLPQEQEYGAASARMVMARNSAPQLEVSFVHYYHTQAGSFCFRLVCYRMRVFNSLFQLVRLGLV